MEQPDFRARLEAQAASIVGRARAEAAEIVRRAEEAAAQLEVEAQRRITTAVNDIEGLRYQAHRDMVKAQEQALQIRSDAQRTADGIVERATLRARAEADELLHEARRNLARAVDEKNEAEERIKRAEAAERKAADVLELVAMAAAEAVVEATADAGVPMKEADALASLDLTQPRTPERDRFLVTMSGETFDDLIAGAIRAAVRRSFNPLVRAGRYVEPRVLLPQQRR